MKKMTTKEFIEKASQIHKNIYDYSITEYKNSITKIKYICPHHGVVEQNPRNHLKGNKCSKCIGRNLTTKEWVIRFNKIHKNKYDYSKFIYKGIYNKSSITCLEHGLFEQSPHNHVNGQGCIKCAHEIAWLSNTYYNLTIAERNKSEWLKIPCQLYVIKLTSNTEVFYKIGITSQDILRRFRAHDLPYEIELLYLIDTNRYTGIIKENKLHTKYKNYHYSTKYKFGGHTECFTQLPNIKKELYD